jgi:type IV secretion system protein TrbL
MTPDAGILTSLMNDFRNVFTLGIGNIQASANWLLASLIVIDIVLVLLLKSDDTDVLKLLIEKILFYGFFIYLVTNYRYLVNVVLKSFAYIGLKAGGNGISQAMLSDPSGISEYGVYLSQPIFNHIASFTGMSAFSHFGDILTCLIMGLLVIAAFGFIGIQIFLTYLEFYIVGALVLILIPFGVTKHTAFLSERAIGAVFAFGVKFMVLSFIASAAIPLVKRWQLPDDPSLQMMIYSLLGSAAIAYLAWDAPRLVASLLAGSPSFGATGAIGALTAGAGAAGSALLTTGRVVGGSLKAMGAVAQAGQTGYAARGGVKGVMMGVGRLAAANLPVGQGRQNAYRTMLMHARAMRTAGMKDRLKVS